MCSHGWSPNERSLALGENLQGPPTLSYFLEKRKSHLWTACTAEEAINWAYANKKKIVTDIKESNIDALNHLINKYPLSKQVFIPQIYSIEEFHPVQQLGFEKIILTLYRSNISEQGLVNWLTQSDVSKLYAITTWHHRAPYLTKAMNDQKIPVYIHTVNDINIAKFLMQHYGVQGIYKDNIKSYENN